VTYLVALPLVIAIVMRAVEVGTMAEAEETATARYIASSVFVQLMLKMLFEIIATMADKYRLDMRKKLLQLANTVPLALMVAREKS
jgi:hypothetical protein